jgi:hypothetical protein
VFPMMLNILSRLATHNFFFYIIAHENNWHIHKRREVSICTLPCRFVPFEILKLSIGIGRTGIVCVCYLLWSKHPECDSPKAAIQHFLKVRTRGPNNLQRKFIKKFFEHIQSKWSSYHQV